MASRKGLLDTLRDQLSKIGRRLGTQSLARCTKGGQRDFLAREFMKPFRGVASHELDETLYEWMTGDRPDHRSVQTVLQVLIETGNEDCIDTVLDCIDVRVGGGAPSTQRRDLQLDQVIQDAWWGDCVLEPFENAFPRSPRLRKKVRTLIAELRTQTRPHPSEAAI